MAEDLFPRLRKIIAEQLGVEESEVTRDASFLDDLNADSLEIMELVMEIEEEFKIEIPDERVQTLRTVGDAYDYLEEQVG